MRVSVRNNKGFSLVELMVVVAIIGILAAIAIPNFQRFTAKSKQSEAKANLSTLYTAEKAFQSEWQTYSSIFSIVGYAPTGTMRYEHGFSAAFGTAAGTDLPNNYTGAPSDGLFNTAGYCAVATHGCNIVQIPIAPGAVAGAMNAISFTAQARGDLTGGTAPIDVWTINELKTLTNVTNGLP